MLLGKLTPTSVPGTALTGVMESHPTWSRNSGLNASAECTSGHRNRHVTLAKMKVLGASVKGVSLLLRRNHQKGCALLSLKCPGGECVGQTSGNSEGN